MLLFLGNTNKSTVTVGETKGRRDRGRGAEILFAFANIAAIKNKYLRPKKDQAQSEHMQEAAAGAAGSVCEIRAPLLLFSTPNPSARQPSARTLDAESSRAELEPLNR